MIPSLNLGKLRCHPPPVLGAPSTGSITPRSGGVLGGSSGDRKLVANHSDATSVSSVERRTQYGGESVTAAAATHEQSAIRSGAVDASEFLGIDVDREADVEVLRAKLHEAKGLLVALDAWYAARLAEKEQLMMHRLTQLTLAVERSGNTVRSHAGGTNTPLSGRRGTVSPRLYPGTPDRRASSPSLSRITSSTSKFTAAAVESVAGTATPRGKSPTMRRSPTSSVASAMVHPRPFGSNPGARVKTSVGGVLLPSPALVARQSASGGGSNPPTPQSTPRITHFVRPGSGHSPLDPRASPSPVTSGGQLSARSAGALSARRTQLHVVNWSSSIPTPTDAPLHVANPSIAGAALSASTYGSNTGVVRGSPRVTTTAGAARVGASTLWEDRRAVTPRY